MRIKKHKETGLKTLCLSYKEWNRLIRNIIKDLTISFSNYEAILEYTTCSILDYIDDKKCVDIQFTTRDGEIITAMDYNDLEFEVKYELDYILDSNYLRGKYEKESK
jgi:hypothetical protein